jgi:16S rRNA pseudouridine516 synthase
MRLDRLLAHRTGLARNDVLRLLAAGRVRVDGQVTDDGPRMLTQFSRVELDDQVLQSKQAHYLMLHKPVGCASTTRDDTHRTVLDFIHEPWRDELHLAGRLDFNTSGLLLLTNDGRWSRTLTEPRENKPKVYQVETEDPIHPDTAEVFARGIYFAYENLTTRPALLELLGTHSARLTLYEGRYHQVKRMFGYFNNKVTGLHRERIGHIVLDDRLAPGEYRALTDNEVRLD